MPTPTQNFVDISGIKDGIVILKNGSYRLIFSVSAVNFSLKSEEEQNSIIFQYQSFLNSLHFPIEVVMRSQRLNLTPYLKKISEAKDKQTNELLQLQTEDYINFVNELIKIANIMKKNFYAVIPFDPISLKSGTFIDKIFKKSAASSVRVSEDEYKSHKDELLERANTVASGLGSIGLHCKQLSTEEIIELFYKIYNPEVADQEQISNSKNLTSDYVSLEKEKKEQEQNETDNQEEVIDNSAFVQDQQKQQAQIKQQQEAKEAEKQMVRSAPASRQEPVNEKVQPQNAPPANQNPAPIPNSQPVTPQQGQTVPQPNQTAPSNPQPNNTATTPNQTQDLNT